MAMNDMPWGAETIVLNTEVDFDGAYGDLALRRLEIDTDEMTTFHRHEDKNEVLVLEQGLVEIRTEDDYHELAEGEAHFIENGEPHQIQNIGGEIATIVEINFPFDPEDVTHIEDPYLDGR